MTFVNVYRERKATRSNHWVAIWRTVKGNVVHDILPLDHLFTADEAREYAAENPPTWRR